MVYAHLCAPKTRSHAFCTPYLLLSLFLQPQHYLFFSFLMFQLPLCLENTWLLKPNTFKLGYFCFCLCRLWCLFLGDKCVYMLLTRNAHNSQATSWQLLKYNSILKTGHGDLMGEWVCGLWKLVSGLGTKDKEQLPAVWLLLKGWEPFCQLCE